jgi:hypothetical protein
MRTLKLRGGAIRAGVFGLAVASSVGVVFSLALAGCFHLVDDCEWNPKLRCGSWTVPVTGDGGGTPAACVPSENHDPIDDMCGVFVSSSKGREGGAGTKSAPFKMLQEAIEKADGKPVYVCAEEFAGSVTVANGSPLFGGLECMDGWTYVGATKKTTLMGDADTVALTLASTAKGAEVTDFTIQAANAMAAGGSSIAVVADRVEVRLTRCGLVAGDGVAGLAGDTSTDPIGPSDPSDVAIKGNDGQRACTDPVQQFGGAPKENALCPVANGGPVGGAGGLGFVASGNDGSSGAPPVSGKGAGGKGETFAGWDCSVGGMNGGGAAGGSGSVGVAGDGAKGDALGALDSKGYIGASGQLGANGAPGQGGGGGGGAKGKTSCAGASGGGGGAGGCGGKGGGGGKAGGASIGLISLGATLTFDKVSIQVGTGGSGGDGGAGQAGGSGGNGGNGGTGNGTADACNGGKGGQGGFGGQGGGGRGGHAIGIAAAGGSMPATEGVTFNQGTPGPGGKGADPMHDGDPGVKADVQAFQ